MDKSDIIDLIKVIGWIVLIVLCIITPLLERRATEKRINKVMESAKKIPEPDPAIGTPLFYSIQEDDWVYSTQPRTSTQIENE